MSGPARSSLFRAPLGSDWPCPHRTLLSFLNVYTEDPAPTAVHSHLPCLVRERGKHDVYPSITVLVILSVKPPKKSVYGNIKRGPGRNIDKDGNDEERRWPPCSCVTVGPSRAAPSPCGQPGDNKSKGERRVLTMGVGEGVKVRSTARPRKGLEWGPGEMLAPHSLSASLDSASVSSPFSLSLFGPASLCRLSGPHGVAPQPGRLPWSQAWSWG